MAEEVEADAFKRLYPDQYYTRFLGEGVRPDGRPLGRARAVTVGAGAITSADGSALVKIGRSSALAGVRLDIIRPDETAPGLGQLSVKVELAPFSTADYRPGRQPEAVSAVAERLSSALLGTASTSTTSAAPGAPDQGSSGAVQLSSLCIAEGKAAWRAQLDIYILDADGCMLDVALLAAVAALRNTKLPAVRSTHDGKYYRARRRRTGGDAAGGAAANGEGDDAAAEGEEGEEGEDGAAAGASGASATAAGAGGAGGLVAGSPTAVGLDRCPLALTCCLYQGHVLVDPTSDEEKLAQCSVTVVVDERHRLQGVYKAGGKVLADPATLVKCVEAARMRHKELLALMQQSLAAA